LTRFETENRYYAKPEGGYEKAHFFCLVENHFRQDGLLIPRKMSANWTLDGKPYQYWRGTIKEIRFH